MVDGRRKHFASAMTLLQRSDGDDAQAGASYLELVEILLRFGGQVERDLEQLWRRIVFFVLISNTDDHLRNHGFLLTPKGWTLAPAYDMNANAYGAGLKLNISESDNAQDLDLVREVAPHFRIGNSRANELISTLQEQIGRWRSTASDLGLSAAAHDRMKRAFRLVDGP